MVSFRALNSSLSDSSRLKTCTAAVSRDLKPLLIRRVATGYQRTESSKSKRSSTALIWLLESLAVHELTPLKTFVEDVLQVKTRHAEGLLAAARRVLVDSLVAEESAAKVARVMVS